MSRLFNGTSSEATWSLGSVVGTGAWTFAVIVKFDAAVVWQGLLNLETTPATHRVGIERHGTNNDFASITGGGVNTQNSTLLISSTDGWMVLAAAKAAGNVTVRFTKYPIAGAAPSQATSGGTQDNVVAANEILFGNTAGADWFDGWVAAVAVWDTNLNDAQMLSLGSSMSRANWLSLTPKFLADEQDAFVRDHAGTSTQTALSNTTASTDNPAGWASWGGGILTSPLGDPSYAVQTTARGPALVYNRPH